MPQPLEQLPPDQIRCLSFNPKTTHHTKDQEIDTIDRPIKTMRIHSAAASLLASMNAEDAAWPSDVGAALSSLKAGHAFTVPEVTFRKVAALSDLDREAWSMRNLNYEDFDDRLKEIAASAGAYFVSKVELVCPGQECTVMADGEFTYTDAQHWTVPGLKLYGARLLQHPVFIEAMESARQRREQR